MPYDELVKRLRESVGNRDEKCDCCPYEEDYPCCVDCLDKMHREAADAIEDLSKPRWISVTEALPEEPYGCLLIVRRDSPYDGGDDFLNYLPYFAGWDGEQWSDDDGVRVPFEVAYWMPLPELPKEVDT